MIQGKARFACRDIDPGFSYSRLWPQAPARRLVEDYWEIRAARCRTAVEAALPDTAVEIYFNLGPSGRHALNGIPAERPGPRAAWVTGPRAQSVLIAKETRDCDIVGVRLQAGGARQVLGIPAHELNGSVVDLDHLWGPVVAEIRERLSAAANTQDRIEIVERAVLRRAAEGGADHRLRPIEALCAAVDSRRFTSVTQIADAFGLTHRRVIALFEEHVGLKPKTYHRVQRLRQAMKAAGSPRRAPWAQVAVQSGFCDQAHLIHEFRRLTGLTPVEYSHRRTRVGDGFVPMQFAPGDDDGTAQARL